MTKTKNPRRVPIYRRPITIIIVVLLIVVAIAVFFFLKFTQPDQPTDSTVPTNTPSPIEQSSSSAAENPPDKAIQFEGEDPNQLEELTGSITRRSISGGELTVVASIDQYLSSGSTCRLILKDTSGAEIQSTDALPVEAEATSSACGPLTVSISQLSGTYTIDVTVVSPDKSGHIITEINI